MSEKMHKFISFRQGLAAAGKPPTCRSIIDLKAARCFFYNYDSKRFQAAINGPFYCGWYTVAEPWFLANYMWKSEHCCPIKPI